MPIAPARTDYDFAGWNTAANGTGSSFTATTAVTNNITVYAQWLRSAKRIESFVFAASDNPVLSSDVTGSIDHTALTVIVKVPGNTDVSSLKPLFSLSTGSYASIGAVLQVSGDTDNDYTHPVIYKITAENGSTNDYTVYIAHEFVTSGSVINYVVPSGVTQLKVVAWGAAGGYHFQASNYISGAKVTATLGVTAAETLEIRIGGAGGPGGTGIRGAGGYNGGGDAGPVGANGGGGGGGGATDIRRTPYADADRLVVAGGGGGRVTTAGGAGGQNGGNGETVDASIPGGNGATQSAPGAATTGASGENGYAGSGSTGGRGGGAGHRYSGGGGGGGYYGGGGGGCGANLGDAGGGGGSSYGPVGTVYESGVNAGNSNNGKMLIMNLD